MTCHQTLPSKHFCNSLHWYTLQNKYVSIALRNAITLRKQQKAIHLPFIGYIFAWELSLYEKYLCI
jgi:hypothetical protein